MCVNYFFFAFWAHLKCKLGQGEEICSHNSFTVGPLHHQGDLFLSFPLQSSLWGRTIIKLVKSGTVPL